MQQPRIRLKFMAGRLLALPPRPSSGEAIQCPDRIIKHKGMGIVGSSGCDSVAGAGSSVMQCAGIPCVLLCRHLTLPPLGAPEQRGGILINSSCLVNIIGIWY